MFTSNNFLNSFFRSQFTASSETRISNIYVILGVSRSEQRFKCLPKSKCRSHCCKGRFYCNCKCVEYRYFPPSMFHVCWFKWPWSWMSVWETKDKQTPSWHLVYLPLRDYVCICVCLCLFYLYIYLSMSVCLSNNLFIFLYIILSSLSMYLSLFVYLFVCRSFYLYVCLPVFSIYVSVYSSIYPSIYLSVCLTVHIYPPKRSC